MSDETKRTISLIVFGFGIFGGLWGCAAWTGGIFVIGANDSLPEILALTFTLATPLPACVLALWRPVIAGSWLVFAGLFFPYGMLAQRAYMIHARHAPDQLTVLQMLRGSVPVSGVLIGFGFSAS